MLFRNSLLSRYFRSTGASIICVQEGRALCDFPAIANRYQRFAAAGDEYTMVLVPRGMEVESFSAPVLPLLQAALSAQASAETAKAWRTTSARVAVVRVQGFPKDRVHLACFALSWIGRKTPDRGTVWLFAM